MLSVILCSSVFIFTRSLFQVLHSFLSSLKSLVPCYSPTSLSLLFPSSTMVPFYFPGFCSYSRLHTHIWRFGTRSLKWESIQRLPFLIDMIFSISIHGPSGFVFFFSLQLSSITQCMCTTFSLSTPQLKEISIVLLASCRRQSCSKLYWTSICPLGDAEERCSWDLISAPLGLPTLISRVALPVPTPPHLTSSPAFVLCCFIDFTHSD